jgi:hypothetical protein
MSLISNGALQAVLDKMARFAAVSVGDTAFNVSFTAGMEAASAAVLSGAGAIDAYVLATADLDVIADLIPAAVALDENHPTPPDRFIFGIAGISKMEGAIAAHIKRLNGAASIDAYLTILNTSTPTLRVHAAYSDHLKSMSAKNVFIGADQDIARINVTGAAAGTYVHLSTIDKTKYGGAKLVAKNVGAVTASTVLSITGKKFDGTTATVTATITTLTDGFETNLSDTAKIFVDVTNITVTSGGTNANTIKIVAKTDRDITSA